MRRLLALTLSFLILTLSAGGKAFVSVDITDKDGCAKNEKCCCGCDERTVPPNDKSDFPTKGCPSKGCPFCVSNTCPGFAAVVFADMPELQPEGDYEECAFILQGYISPLVKGVWQPPWSV